MFRVFVDSYRFCFDLIFNTALNNLLHKYGNRKFVQGHLQLFLFICIFFQISINMYIEESVHTDIVAFYLTEEED